MAVSTNSLNDVNLDSFFQETILDNNGVTVTDINLGLMNLFRTFNDYSDQLHEEERYLVHDFEEGYPDLVAKHSVLGDQHYWWWILLLNRLENPMTDLKTGWVYSINSQNQVSEFINTSNSQENSTNNKRIGTIIELN